MKSYETVMLEIQDTLVSLDLIERYFCCDLDTCRGQCCIDGDAGAPVTEEERERLERVLPAVWDDLLPAARRVIGEQGVSYVDEEGDLVTSIIPDTGNCVFTTYGPGGMCLCAVEKACREGRTDFLKPVSCHLYPVRVTQYPTFKAVNVHRWKICRCAEVLGRKNGMRAYRFLAGPLTAAFGKEWYDELCLAAEEYLRQNPDK